MNFKGHDYGELLDAFGLREEYDKAFDEHHDGNLDTYHLDIEMIVDYINDHVTTVDGETHIEDSTRQHMVDFLSAIIGCEHTSRGDKNMFAAILWLSFDSDDLCFWQWFVHCLPMMWN
jgi:hypothetical protein